MLVDSWTETGGQYVSHNSVVDYRLYMTTRLQGACSGGFEQTGTWILGKRVTGHVCVYCP